MKKSMNFFIILLFLFGLFVCSENSSGRVESELKSYEGGELSSINEFRENSIKGPQKVNIEKYRLKISGLVEEPKEYTYNHLLDSFPSKKRVETLNCVEGWSVKILWEGIPLKELLFESKPKEEVKTVIFRCHDGYTTSLKYQYIEDNNLLLAYKMNGIKLPEERGFPFQLMAAGKWGYKWAKWVIEIELISDEEYRGFWEQKGYSNDASLDKNFFEE